jgi:hypothetical protein
MINKINPRTHPNINQSEGLPTKKVSPVYTQLIKQVIGILEIFHRTLLKPNAEWLDFLKTLTGQAAIAIDGIRTYNNLQCSNMDLSMHYDIRPSYPEGLDEGQSAGALESRRRKIL